jgi:hypothetical protein
MRLDIDVSRKHFTVAKAPVPRVDPEGVQRVSKPTGDPQWITQLFVRDEDGGHVLDVITFGKKPDIDAGEDVRVEGLFAYEWTGQKGRHGINFRASSIVFDEATP